MRDKTKFIICVIISILVLNFAHNLNTIVINMMIPEIYNEGISVYNLIQNLIDAIVFGILIGSTNYMVFICSQSTKKKILNYFLNLFVASILMTIYLVCFGMTGEKYNCAKCIMQVIYYIMVFAIPYLFIIMVANLINYIYQRCVIKKLNAELKKEDVTKLNKKIVVVSLFAIIIFVCILLIGFIAFNSAIIV